MIPTEHAAAHDGPLKSGPLVGPKAFPLALGIGLVGMALSGVGLLTDPVRAVHGYLVAYVFWISLAWGSLGWLMSFHAGRSQWVIPLRRLLEISSATLPIFALLFLPIAVELPKLYSWAGSTPDWGAGDPSLFGFRKIYMGYGFFFGRALFYFVFWGLLGWFLFRWSTEQDSNPGEPTRTLKQRYWSAAGLPGLGLTISFAAIDWIMTLRLGWTSSMFGFYLISASIVGAMALFTILIYFLQRSGLLPGPLQRRQLHNVGKLLFAFVIFWAYIAFGQYLLIWMANLPRETPWMILRTQGPWLPVGVFLALGHFALPFLLLLPVTLKLKPGALAIIGGWVLFTCYVDVYWLVMPKLAPDQPLPQWTDLTTFFGVGGLAAAYWIWLARRSAAVPLGDPYLQEALLASHG